MWALFHLIRFIWQAKGLCRASRGHMERTARRTNVVAIS